MPIYEYRCRDCGESLEVRQAFTDDALTECPNCSGSLRKLFSTPGISFKGSGFYKTDSRSGGSGSSSSAPSTAKTGADGASSSDPKPSSGSDKPSSSESSSTSSESKKSDSKPTGSAAKSTAGASSPAD